MVTADRQVQNPRGRSAGEKLRQASHVGKRNVLQAGFGLVIALLVFSTFKAYQIQGSLSDEARQIYHRHLRQDDLLYGMRRTLWLGASTCRDFLLNPSQNRLAAFEREFNQYRAESVQFLDELERTEMAKSSLPRLREKVQEFWESLGRTPLATMHMSPHEQFEYVRKEIVPRRSAVGGVVQEFTEISQDALRESEAEFSRNRRSAANRLLVTLAVSLLLGLAVSALSLRHEANLEREAARRYEEVLQAKANLHQLSARLMQIQEEERTRLSRELHDEIGQALATLRLEIARAESPGTTPEQLHERLATARALAERTMQTIRNISLLLRPSLLDDLGLGAAMQWLTEDFTRRTGVKCRLVDAGLDEDLPDAVRTGVYRVVQEALHNCEKHARATEAAVAVEQRPGLLMVTVTDNGCGFLPESGESAAGLMHFGLLGMRERAGGLGGSIEIDSAPGTGTRITLRLPVEERCEPESPKALAKGAGLA